MATGTWTLYTAPDPVTLAAALESAGVVVADKFDIEHKGAIWYAFVVEA